MSENTQLAALVAQSKQALQHAEQLCQRTSATMHASADTAVSILTLDAKLKWLATGVLEQFKLAAQVAKTLEEQRTRIAAEAKDWDKQRVAHTMALDAVLDECGAQLVPPSFYAHPSPPGSPVFRAPESPPPTPTPKTLLAKTLRDFIDERALEDAVDRIDEERNQLDDVLYASPTARALTQQLAELQNAMPPPTPERDVESLLHAQDAASGPMATHLSALVMHYGQMAEASVILDEMVRDTAELPAVIVELEESDAAVSAVHAQLLEQQSSAEEALAAMEATLFALESLEPMLDTLLAEHVDAEATSSTLLVSLHAHLDSLAGLRDTYTQYRLAYARLLLELERRARYAAASEKTLRDALAALEGMREEEERDRGLFFLEQGAYLPEDLCVYVGNAPPRWEVVGAREELPQLGEALLEEARRTIDVMEGRV